MDASLAAGELDRLPECGADTRCVHDDRRADFTLHASYPVLRPEPDDLTILYDRTKYEVLVKEVRSRIDHIVHEPLTELVPVDRVPVLVDLDHADPRWADQLHAGNDLAQLVTARRSDASFLL